MKITRRQLRRIIKEELKLFVNEAKEQGLEEGKKDACYDKVKSRYKVWPSAYASGALVKCRKVGARTGVTQRKKA